MASLSFKYFSLFNFPFLNLQDAIFMRNIFLQSDRQGLGPVPGSDWTNIIIPGEASISGFHHEKTFLLPELVPDAQYECLVQAKNVHGWSEASRIHRFFTHSNAYGKNMLHAKNRCPN